MTTEIGTSEKLPEGNLEKALFKKNQRLYSKYIQHISDTIPDLASRQQKKEGDTNSALSHLKSVHLLSDRLIPADKCNNLNDIEIYILLMSVYLHDIGKIIETGGGTEHHSIEGKKFLLNNHKDLKLEMAESIAIAHIVEAHGPHMSMENIPNDKGIEPYGKIRMRYLASVLKLADELEMSYTRAPSSAKAIENPKGSISNKWNIRESIQYVDIDPTTWIIKIISTPNSHEISEVISREVNFCNEKLQKLRPFLRATTDIGLYYSYIDIDNDSVLLPKTENSNSSEQEKLNVIDKSIKIGKKVATVIIDKTQESLNVYDSLLKPCLEEIGFCVIEFSECLTSGNLRKKYSTIFNNSDLIIALVPDVIDGATSFCLRIGAAITTEKELLFLSKNQPSPLAGDFASCEINNFDSTSDLKSIINDFLNKNDH